MFHKYLKYKLLYLQQKGSAAKGETIDFKTIKKNLIIFTKLNKEKQTPEKEVEIVSILESSAPRLQSMARSKSMEQLINIATNCIKKLSPGNQTTVGYLYMTQFPDFYSIYRLSLIIYSLDGKPSQAIELYKIKAAGIKKQKKKFSSLRDIAVNGINYLTEEDYDNLILLWEEAEQETSEKKTDTEPKIKEMFFLALIKKFGTKALIKAIYYVPIWVDVLWKSVSEKKRLATDEELKLLKFMPIILSELIQELKKALAQPKMGKNNKILTTRNGSQIKLSEKNLKLLLKHINSPNAIKLYDFKSKIEVNVDVPDNAIFIDGSNLYFQGHFNENMMIQAETLLSSMNFIYVGHANRIKQLKKYKKNRLFFEIPKKANFANDDIVWQLLALKYQKPFLTNDIGRDHRKNLSVNFYNWYTMNWYKRVGGNDDMTIQAPPQKWRQVQLIGRKLMLPDPIQQDTWWVVDL